MVRPRSTRPTHSQTPQNRKKTARPDARIQTPTTDNTTHQKARARLLSPRTQNAGRQQPIDPQPSPQTNASLIQVQPSQPNPVNSRNQRARSHLMPFGDTVTPR